METKLLPIKSFQETLHGGFCGPAVIKMALDFYGIEKTEAEIASLTKKDKVLGIGDEEIKKVLESFGFKVEIKSFASFEDIKISLEKGAPVIVNWFSRGRKDYGEDEVADGHYSIVVGLDNKYIYLQDPEVGRIRKILKEHFIRVWFDFTTDHIEKWEDLVVRQMITVL
jgi:ABC-type bacteriocin/lantibiotic exporter with double-glycine peptidase domain